MIMIIVRFFQGKPEETPLFGRLLRHGSDSFAAIAVLAVLGWLLIESFLHVVRIWRERSAIQQIKGVAPERLLYSKVSLRSRAGRRTKLAMDHYFSAPEYLHDALPAAAALDAGALESTYSLTKVYVWILPVIGFIGTAWGMSHAIGGFSQALGETKDVTVLADRLGQLVIPGLANAFSITILALGAAIVAHFWVTTVQAADQEALDELDRASVTMLAKIPKGQFGTGIGGNIPPETLQILQALVEQLRQIAYKLDLDDAAQRLSEAADQISVAANETRLAADDVGKAAEVLKDSVSMPYHITVTRGNR